MREPFYMRPPDYRYCLRSNPAYGWATGTTEDGSHVLRTEQAVLLFDVAGNLVRVARQDNSLIRTPLREEPIQVKRFWLPNHTLGIQDIEDPAESEMLPEDVEGWIEDGQFLFYPGWGEYIMGRLGNVEAS